MAKQAGLSYAWKIDRKVNPQGHRMLGHWRLSYPSRRHGFRIDHLRADWLFWYLNSPPEYTLAKRVALVLVQCERLRDEYKQKLVQLSDGTKQQVRIERK